MNKKERLLTIYKLMIPRAKKETVKWNKMSWQHREISSNVGDVKRKEQKYVSTIITLANKKQETIPFHLIFFLSRRRLIVFRIRVSPIWLFWLGIRVTTSNAQQEFKDGWKWKDKEA